MKYLGLKFSPKDLGAKVFFSNLVLLCGREEKYVKSLGHWRHFTRGNCMDWPCFSTLLLVSNKKSSFAWLYTSTNYMPLQTQKNEAKLLYESLKLGIKISGICYNTGKYY